jgi:hypothetical protein
MTEGAAPEGEHEILKASSPGADELSIGIEVVSLDGHRLGHVKEVRATDFLLERPRARDLYVPYGKILATPARYTQFSGGPNQPTEVVLSVDAEEIDSQGWPHA